MQARCLSRSLRRGFTLTELIAALAIIVVFGAVAMVSTQSLINARKLEHGANHVIAAVRRARALSVAGQVQAVAVRRRPPGSGRITPTPPTLNLRPIVHSGIEIPGPTRLHVYSRDSSGAQRIAHVVSLPQLFPGSDLQITSPAPPERIVFRRDGTRDLETPDRIVIENVRTHRRMVIEINGAGIPRLGR